MGGSCNWLKTIITSKGLKDEHASKHTKLLSSSKDDSNGVESKKKGSPGQKLTRDVAALRIQSAFRRFKARKVLRRLRAIGRYRGTVPTLISGSDENQTFSTLKHVHFWTKMQAEIKARRLWMVSEGRSQQRKQENKMKLEAKLQELEVDWCGGSETMEEILQRIQQKEVAAVKRERAMAYAFSHQWRANSSPYFGQAYYDLGKGSWGWSWRERWIAVRPWESRVQATNTTNSKKAHSKPEKAGKTSNNHSSMRIIVTVKPSLPRKLSDH